MPSCVGYQYKMSGQKPLAIGPFLLMEVLCGISGMLGLLAQLETGWGN
jgi:hypothetical protein